MNKRQFLFLILVVVGCSDGKVPVPRPSPGRVLYANARIYTLTDEARWADALLASGSDIE